MDRFQILFAGLVCFPVFFPPTADAAQRTFVSVLGADSNTASNCSQALPCRSFAAAMTVTDEYGEIIVQTSGGYGPLTINDSVSIIAPQGVYAGISVFSGNGVTINAPLADIKLRGLTINGLGGTTGISASAGATLIVEDCRVSGFQANGISIQTPMNVTLLNSIVDLNGSNGVAISNGAKALVSQSRILHNNTSGIYALGNSVNSTTVKVSHSDIKGNKGHGVNAVFQSGAWLSVAVSDSVPSLNGSCGIRGEGSGTRVTASNNWLVDNDYGLCQVSSAVFRSTHDNTSEFNGSSPSFGTITSASKI